MKTLLPLAPALLSASVSFVPVPPPFDSEHAYATRPEDGRLLPAL